MKLPFDKTISESFNNIVVLANNKTILNSRFAKKVIKDKVIRVDQLVKYIKEINDDYKKRRSDAAMYEMANILMPFCTINTKDYSEKYKTMIQTNIKDEEIISTLSENKILCPICGSEMVRRVASKGNNIGLEFYGCSKYPLCKGIVNIKK